MQAQHWFSTERLQRLGHTADEPRWCTVGGYYTNSLVRTDAGWRIARCHLTVTWVTGDRSVFDIARALGQRPGDGCHRGTVTCLNLQKESRRMTGAE